MGRVGQPRRPAAGDEKMKAHAMWLGALLLAAALVADGAGQAGQTAATGSTAIVGGAVIDGDGGGPVAGAVVLGGGGGGAARGARGAGGGSGRARPVGPPGRRG